MPAGLFHKARTGASAKATAPEPPMPFLGAFRDTATNLLIESPPRPRKFVLAQPRKAPGLGATDESGLGEPEHILTMDDFRSKTCCASCRDSGGNRLKGVRGL